MILLFQSDTLNFTSPKDLINTGVETAIQHLEDKYRSTSGEISESFYAEVLAIHQAKNDLFEKLDRAESSSGRPIIPSIQSRNKRHGSSMDEYNGDQRKYLKFE